MSLGGGKTTTIGQGSIDFKPLGAKAFRDQAEVEGFSINTTNDVKKKFSYRDKSVSQIDSQINKSEVSGKFTCCSPVAEILQNWLQGTSAVQEEAEVTITAKDCVMHQNGWMPIDTDEPEKTGRAKPASLLVMQKTGLAFTADDSTDVITATAHGLAVGDIVRFSSTTTLPAGLSADTDYFVISAPDANTFTVSLTKGGAIVDITDTGTGTHSMFYKFEEGRDYALLPNRGDIYAIPALDGGRIDTTQADNGETVSVTATFAARRLLRIEMLSNADLRGTLRFHGDSKKGAKGNHVYDVQLRPTGDLSQIGEEFMKFDFEFDILKLNPTEPFGTYFDTGDNLNLPAK